MNFEPQEYLNTVSSIDDADIDLGKAAIALAALQQPGISTDRYLHHLKKLSEEVGERYMELVEEGAQQNVQTQLASLKHIISDKHAYVGDQESFENIDNANLIRVIDRGQGLSITLAVLYIQSARAQGWNVEGIDLPGHFVCRLEKGGERLIFDPFEGCRVLEAPDLRLKLKEALGEQAELSADYFEPVGNRHILIGIQNNIKFRKISVEDYQGALEIVETMRLIDPNEYRLLLDAGVLHAKLDEPKAAIEVLEGYIEKAPYNRDRHEAEALLYELRRSLN